MRKPGPEAPDAVLSALVAVAATAVAVVAVGGSGRLEEAFAVALIALSILLWRGRNPPGDDR
jgi:hypothetical protein